MAHLQTTAVEYGLTLSRTSLPAGKVVLEFVNRGQDEHNLNIVTEGQTAGAFSNAQAHTVSDQAVVLKAGIYTLFCSLPEHASKAMRATLVVE